MSRFNIVNRRNGAPLARRDVESIWGTHFVQAGKRGLASLHFAPDASQAWVCYDVKIIPSSWRLDNGQPPPSRKNFADFRYDPVHRVFTGYILWTPSPFSGHVRWDYRMKFDDKFQSIVGGTVRAYRLDGSLGEEMAFGRDIVYRRVRENIFDATYVQMTPVTSLLADYGAMVGHASYHFTRDDAWISYASAPESWKLDSGARIPLKKYFVDFSYDARARIFRGVIDWGQDPIANASRWEYEMHFDPSFRNIASGIVRTVFLDGTVEVHNFGSDIIYTLYEPETSCCP